LCSARHTASASLWSKKPESARTIGPTSPPGSACNARQGAPRPEGGRFAQSRSPRQAPIRPLPTSQGAGGRPAGRGSSTPSHPLSSVDLDRSGRGRSGRGRSSDLSAEWCAALLGSRAKTLLRASRWPAPAEHVSSCRNACPADHYCRRRHVRHCPKPKPGCVDALVVEATEEVPACEGRLGERHHHTPEHEPTSAALERRSVVDRRSDPESLSSLATRWRPAPGGDSAVRCAQHHLGTSFSLLPSPDRCLPLGMRVFNSHHSPG
jgi:hypothetical protein